jgi:hypothetical protein
LSPWAQPPSCLRIPKCISQVCFLKDLLPWFQLWSGCLSSPSRKVLLARILFLCIHLSWLFQSKAPFLYKLYATPGAEGLFLHVGSSFLGIMKEECPTDLKDEKSQHENHIITITIVSVNDISTLQLITHYSRQSKWRPEKQITYTKSPSRYMCPMDLHDPCTDGQRRRKLWLWNILAGKSGLPGNRELSRLHVGIKVQQLLWPVG